MLLNSAGVERAVLNRLVREANQIGTVLPLCIPDACFITNGKQLWEPCLAWEGTNGWRHVQVKADDERASPNLSDRTSQEISDPDPGGTRVEGFHVQLDAAIPLFGLDVECDASCPVRRHELGMLDSVVPLVFVLNVKARANERRGHKQFVACSMEVRRMSNAFQDLLLKTFMVLKNVEIVSKRCERAERPVRINTIEFPDLDGVLRAILLSRLPPPDD